MSDSTLATQTISFNEISYDIRRPSTQIEVAANYSNIGLVAFPTKALLVGLALPAAAGAAGGPYQIFRKGQGAQLFGPGSMLARMCDAFLLANPNTPLYALAQPAGQNWAAAAGQIAVQGNLLANSTIPFYFGGRYIPVVLRQTDGVFTQAATIAAAVNADALCPVTAVASGAAVALTAKQYGEWGNSIPLFLGNRGDDLSPPGTWSCAITPMAGGAGVPDINATLTRIANSWYTDVAYGYLDAASAAAVEADLAARYTATGRKDCTAYTAYSMSLGTALAAGPTRNSKFLCRIPAYSSSSAPWEWAASLAGIASFQFANDPSRQLRTLSLPGIYAPPPQYRFLDQDREQLLRCGMSTFDCLSDGSVTIERLISSYQTSDLGVPDTAWLDIMTAKTMTRIRYDWRSYVGLVYPRHRLADDDSVAAEFSGVVATPRRLWNSWAGRCGRLYEPLGWIEGAARTSAQAVFVRDPSDHNRVNARQLVRVIGNLMVLAGRLEFEA